VNVRTGNVVGGHQRIKNLDPGWSVLKHAVEDVTGTVAEGKIETPWGGLAYREVDWDEAREKAANLAANKHGGDWDMPKVEIMLEELKAINFDLELTGFKFDTQEDLGSDEAPDADNNYAQQYGVIVMCEDEGHQERVYNFLAENGYNCKVVNT
jgi:hypothetical protein